MRKSQTTAFLLLLFYIEKFIFCQKIYVEKLSLYFYICITVFSRGRLLEMQCLQRQYRYYCFCKRHTSIQNLGNRLGILTQILIAMDNFFYLYISEKYFQFRKKTILGNQFHYNKYKERDRNISKTFVFKFLSQYLT